MKRLSLFMVVSLFVFTLFSFTSIHTSPISEAPNEVIGEELITHGGFDFTTTELRFPDPVFGASYGVAQGWGSLPWDSAAMAIYDPADAENTVMKLSYSDSGQNWSSFFRFTSIQASATYDISIDFKVVGTTDNLGMRFAGPGPGLEIIFLNHASKTAIPDKDGWYNVQFQWTTASDSNYDSIAMWFNTGGSVDNYALIDNIVVAPEGTTDNLIVGGDFEGFMDYAPAAELTTEPNVYGFFGENGEVGSGSAILNTGGVLGKVVTVGVADYQFEMSFTASDLTDSDVYVKFETDTVFDIGQAMLVVQGVIDPEWVTADGDLYTVSGRLTADQAATSLIIAYDGNFSIEIHNISLKQIHIVPDSPFDPDIDYFQGPNMIVNGDFEAFEVGTVFSEAQLEGAWGSVGLDGPAKIALVDDSNVMSIGQTDGKTFSSAFVMSPPELDVGDLLRLQYDVKLNLTGSPEDYYRINTSFVGVSNIDYYRVDLTALEDGMLSEGEELLNMPIVVEDLGNGWVRITLDFEVTANFLIRANSLRFLFTPNSADDFVYFDNVGLFMLLEEEPSNDVTALNIVQNDQDLDVGDTLQLTFTYTPTTADAPAVLWSSSNTSVATVSANGLVTAVGAGAVEITVATAEGEITDSIVLSVFAVDEEPEPKTGCFGSSMGVGTVIVMALVATTALASITLLKRK